MINNTSTNHDAVAVSRGGPLTQTLEERRGRSMDTNTRQRNVYQSVSKHADPDCGAVPFRVKRPKSPRCLESSRRWKHFRMCGG